MPNIFGSLDSYLVEYNEMEEILLQPVDIEENYEWDNAEELADLQALDLNENYSDYSVEEHCLDNLAY